MPFKRIDVSGHRFGMLVAISAVNGVKGMAKWLCACDCGASSIVAVANLRSGHTTSCGCKRFAKQVEIPKRSRREHSIWSNIVQRTTNQNCKEYKWYGARGIRMHEEWRTSFDAFLKYVDGLPKAGTTLDRIDNNGNYEPGNLRWATHKEQSNNARSNRIIEFNGKTMTLSQWADATGIPSPTLGARINRLKWPIERALTTPLRGS